jgi:hypothetical protein
MSPAAITPVKGLKKRCRFQNVTPKSRQKRKDRTRRNLAAACRKNVSHHATAAWRKRKIFRKSGVLESCGSQKRVTVADKRTSPHATVAWQKRNLTRNILI